MPARLESKRMAVAMLRSLHNADVRGAHAAAFLARHLPKAVARTYRAGQDPTMIVEHHLQAMAPILVEAMLLAYLTGLEILFRLLRAHTKRSIAISFATKPTSIYSRQIASVVRRIQLPVDQVHVLEEEYGTVATRVLRDASDSTNRALLEAIRQSKIAGEHVEDGVLRLQQALESEGITSLRPHQVEAIFRTQTQMANSAGQWAAEQDEEIQEILWGYEYTTVDDDRVRDSHSMLDGILLPTDHPFWDGNFPPNGYNCRCAAIPIFEEVNPVFPPDDYPGPDPGFDFNPGRVLDAGVRPRFSMPTSVPPGANLTIAERTKLEELYRKASSGEALSQYEGKVVRRLEVRGGVSRSYPKIQYRKPKVPLPPAPPAPPLPPLTPRAPSVIPPEAMAKLSPRQQTKLQGLMDKVGQNEMLTKPEYQALRKLEKKAGLPKSKPRVNWTGKKVPTPPTPTPPGRISKPKFKPKPKPKRLSPKLDPVQEQRLLGLRRRVREGKELLSAEIEEMHRLEELAGLTKTKTPPLPAGPKTLREHWSGTAKKDAMVDEFTGLARADIYFEEFGPNVAMQNRKYDLVQAMGNETARMYDAFPAIEKAITEGAYGGRRAISHVNVVNKKQVSYWHPIERTRSVSAYYMPGEQYIAMSSKGRRIRSLAGPGVGEWNCDFTYSGIWRHEFAHALEPTPIYKGWGNVWRAHGGKKANWYRDVSHYAGKNMNEAWAESFTAYTHPAYGLKGGRLPKGIEDFFRLKLGQHPNLVGKPVPATIAKIPKVHKRPWTRSKSIPTPSVEKVEVVLRKQTPLAATRPSKKLVGKPPSKPPAVFKKRVEWEKGITKKEQEAVKKWSKGSDQLVRKGQQGLLKGKEEKKRAQKMLDLLESAYAKAPKFSGSLYRGINVKHLSKKEFKALTTAGNTVEFKAWTSTSRTSYTGTHFASKVKMDDVPVIFSMRKVRKTGMRIEGLSKFPLEKEVVLPAGTKFRIIDVIEAGKPSRLDHAFHVYMEQIP